MSYRGRRFHRSLLSILFGLAITISYTSSASVGGDDDIYQVSLQDLMKMEVTSVSKKEQTLAKSRRRSSSSVRTIFSVRVH